MKLQVLSSAPASALSGVDGMVAAVCHDDKQFYTAVDGGTVRRYPIAADEIPRTPDDCFSLKQSHITCIGATHDSSSANMFVIGCSDGNFHVCSANWRVEKTVQAHTGCVSCIAVNPDGHTIVSAGEDGLVKIWTRDGRPRSTLASCGAAVTSINWDCTGKYVSYTYGGMVTVRAASFKQDQTQFRVCRRVITCSDWDQASNEILTGGEDRVARVFDTDGRLIAESQPFEFAVTAVRFLPSARMCLIGTANRLYLTDAKMRLLHTATLPAGSAICVSATQSRAMIAGNGTASLVGVVGKKIVYRDSEVVSESPKKLSIFDVKNGVSETLQFTDGVIDFFLDFKHLIVSTPSKMHIYKAGQWTSPMIVEMKEVPKVVVQSMTMFAFISSSGVQILGYDGRPISRINDTRVKWDLLSANSVAMSPSVFAVVSPDGRKFIFAFSTSTGQMITAEPLSHPSEIRCIRINQATTQAKTRFGFLNGNRDLTICRFVTPNPRVPPSFESLKLTNFVDDFMWHSAHDILLTRNSEKATIWCCPSAVFFTAELMPMLKMELRLMFDAAELSAFDGTHVFMIAKDGAFNVVPVSPFLVMIHEAVESYKNWKSVLQICRAMNEQSFWAVCATCAVQSGEVDAAQEAYAALSMIDRVKFLEKVKKMKSPAARNAMIAVLQGRVNEAEEILIQGGCLFRAVKMNISLGRWNRALAIAKRMNKFVEVVAAYRTKFIKDLATEEKDKEFIKLGEVEMASVKAIIDREREQELA